MPECRVLVVDDDPSIRDTVAAYLEIEGYAPQTASNGAEALEVVDDACPDLVLLDMRMPVLDGWGFAEQVARRDLGLKIIVMTAARDAKAWCTEIGGDGCLPKPFDMDDLMREVHRLCPVNGAA